MTGTLTPASPPPFRLPSQEVLPSTYIDQVLPILLHTLNHPVPRVQAHAACALVNLCDGLANGDGLNPPYLESVVQSLVGLLQADSTQEGVRAQVITSLATVANAAGEAFGRFYGELMPVLIGVLDRGVGEPVIPGPDGEATLGVEERRKRLMKSKVLECCGLMGQSPPRRRSSVMRYPDQLPPPSFPSVLQASPLARTCSGQTPSGLRSSWFACRVRPLSPCPARRSVPDARPRVIHPSSQTASSATTTRRSPTSCSVRLLPALRQD